MEHLEDSVAGHASRHLWRGNEPVTHLIFVPDKAVRNVTTGHMGGSRRVPTSNSLFATRQPRSLKRFEQLREYDKGHYNHLLLARGKGS